MQRILKAFLYSLEGFAAAWRDEAAFRQEIAVAAVALPVAFYIAPSGVALALMAGSILLVLLVELINSAIEAAIDRHGGEIHPLAKKAKDTGSAAVLVAIINAFAVWGAVLFYAV
jgi:diacylglycerol kinase (ATP)